MGLLSKYVPNDRFLDNGPFRFTQPASLNDADDARPEILFDEYAPEDLKVALEAASHSGMHLIDKHDLEALFLAPFPAGRYDEKSFSSLWPAEEPRLREAPFKAISEFDRAVAERAVELVVEQANRGVLVFSLTMAIASEPMWAYYGNNHQGIEVRFRGDHPFFADRLHQITYSDEPVRVSSNSGWVRLCGQTVSTEQILNGTLPTLPLELMLRKRRGWQHEQEVRLLRGPKEATTVSGRDPIGNAIFLFEVPPEAVDSIVLGYWASNDFAQAVLNKVGHSSRWSGVEVRHRVRTSAAGVYEERVR
ncbi:MAG: hypothetical protein FD176_2643 [Rhodospirillaceae bacterium]|nr:MAG: hypothetical protein FD176_2643 [Rhodospirillaceae bacterium]TNC96361.1 MAG: hypothetical protein FD119_1668 [Stygiobacter sp.]